MLCLLSATAAFSFFAGGNQLWDNKKKVYPLEEHVIDGGYQLPEIAFQEQMAQMEQSYFRVQINARPVIDTYTGKCNLMMGNPGENENNVFVRLLMDETGTEIFRSEILKPGERSPYAVLDLVQEPGDYAVTAVFNILGEDDVNVIGEIEVAIIMTVEP